MKPVVTIIIPSYNHEQYVEKSILSAVQQTYENTELIVIDDGSSDNSPKIIQQLQEHYNFKFIQQENKGLVKTLNSAISMSDGEFFAPFASDDIMMLDRLEKQVPYMQENSDVGICGGNVLIIDQNDVISSKQKIYPERKLTFDDVYLNRYRSSPAPTSLYRRSALEQVGGFNPDIAIEDFYMLLKITSEGYKIGVLNDVLAYYREHPENSHRKLSTMMDGILDIYGAFSDHPNYEDVKIRTLQSHLLMAVKSDKKLARKILQRIPLSRYNMKTIRGIFKLLFITPPKTK